jgi:predicted naringenin-chalcone synthase
MEEEGVGENKWGVMVGFGPGFSVETMVLRATGNLKKTVPL